MAKPVQYKSNAVLCAVWTINKVLFANAREKKKKVPAVPETLKKKRRNFAELKIKRLRKKFAQKMVGKFF